MVKIKVIMGSKTHKIDFFNFFVKKTKLISDSIFLSVFGSKNTIMVLFQLFEVKLTFHGQIKYFVFTVLIENLIYMVFH